MLHFNPALIGQTVTWKHKEHDPEETGVLAGAFISNNHYLHFIVTRNTHVVIICVTTYFEVKIKGTN